jgi:Uma2 family endonuclease
MAVQFQKRHFNVDEYYRMAEAGIFTEDDRVELIEGEIIDMSPIGSYHAGCVNQLSSLLNQKVGQVAVVQVQNPIRLDDFSAPQPDIALLKPRADFYRRSHPTPSDVLLVIEVADTSVDYDRHVKLPLYARAGIPEAWLVILPKDIIEVHSQPQNGKYQKVQRLKRGKTLTSPTIPGLALSVDEILG